MSRVKVPIQSEYPYHLSGRCINREWFSIPLPLVWQIMEEQLFFIHAAFKVEIHAFVLMSNHFHLLASTPDVNLDKAMRWFMQETGRSINKASGRINQVWGGRYFRCLIKSPLHYLHAYKYTYRNPVQAGAATSILEYPFSTLPGLLGSGRLLIPVTDNTLFDMGTEACLRWLDRAVEESIWTSVRNALKKRTFQFAMMKGTNRPSHLENEML